MKLCTMQELMAEMQAVARGEIPAPVDATEPSMEPAEALRLESLTYDAASADVLSDADLDAKAMATYRAGRVVPHERVREWLKQLTHGNRVPPPTE